MNEFSHRDREGQAFWGRDAAAGAVVTLKKLDIPPVGGGCDCDHEVINVRENQSSGYGGMEGGYVYNEQKRRNGGAWGSTHCDRGELPRGALEQEPTFPVGEEAAYPGNDVPMYTLGPKCSSKLGRVDVVEAALDVKEEGGDFKVKALEKANLVGEGGGGVERGEVWEGAGLVGVEEVAGSGDEGETRGGYPLHNLGEGLQEYYDPEGGRRVVGGLAGFVEDDAVGLFEGGGMVTILE